MAFFSLSVWALPVPKKIENILPISVKYGLRNQFKYKASSVRKRFFLISLSLLNIFSSKISIQFFTTWLKLIFFLAIIALKGHCDPFLIAIAPNTFTSLYLFSILIQSKYFWNSQSNCSGQVILVTALINGCKYCKMERL